MFLPEKILLAVGNIVEEVAERKQAPEDGQGVILDAYLCRSYGCLTLEVIASVVDG